MGVPPVARRDAAAEMRVAVIVAGGESIPAAALQELPDGAWVVAADSGVDRAAEIGLRVDYVVGDMDSAGAEALAALGDVPIERHPPDKDATDLELALEAVTRHTEIDRVVVVGGHGGRLDHLLANAAMLGSGRWSHLELEWVAGRARAVVVHAHTHARLHGTPGEQVSLLPQGGPARGVTTTGLRWSLAGEDLAYGVSRGVSNEFATSVATVRLAAGTLLVVQPDAVD